MAQSFRLTRRLPRIQLAGLLALAIGCSDSQDFTSPSEVTSTDQGSATLAVASANGVGCANEPTGYKSFTNQPFSAIPPAAPHIDLFGWKNYTSAPGRLAIQSDPQAPGSPSTTMRGTFPKGVKGGTAPFNLEYKFPKSVTSFYTCVWHKLSSNFTNNGNVGTKLAFILTPYTSFYTGKTGLGHYLNLTTKLGLNLTSVNTQLNRNMISSWNTMAHGDEWHKFEWLVIANTAGKQDGVARIWVDGTQVMNYTNAQYFFPWQKAQFIGLKWNPTYGGGTNPVPYDMFEWIDNWYVSGN